MTEMRHRVDAAVGWPKSAASVCRRHLRKAMPIVPLCSAQSWSRREACLGQRWSEQVRPGDDPEHLASGPGRYTAGKKRCSGSIDRAVTPTGDFVERTDSQAA